MTKRFHSIRTLAAVAAIALAPLASVAPAAAKVVKAASPGEGLLTSNQCTSPNADANTSTWDWTKPMLEVSADNGATWTSAATYTFTYPDNSTKKFAAQVCRNLGGAGSSVSSQSYWFIIQPASGGTDDMGKAVVDAGLQFKLTMPLKSGDTATRMTGYSKVVSFQDSGTTVTAIVKASPIAKVNYQGWSSFVTAHSECANLTEQTWNQCKIAKADRDIAGTVIQHVEFTTSALSSWQTLTKGTWIGANVNGYNMNITCATKGGDSSSNGGSGGNYSGSSDNGSNMSGGSSSSSTPPSLEVTMSGTPHLRADGVTVNEGNLQAFIPEATARSCFGDGTDTIALSTIAENMSVSRTESSENGGAAQSLAAGAYTATAVTSPVAGLLIDVAKMTFSNPTYKVTSKLAQQLLAKYSAGSSATASASAKVKAGKCTITVTLGSAAKFKVYKKVGTKLTLVKSVSGKKGANSVVTLHKKGTSYVVKDASGKVIKTLKP